MKHLVIIKCSSDEQVSKFCAAVQSGHIFIPASEPLPEGAEIDIKPVLHGVSEAFLINGTVATGHAGQNGKNVIDIDISKSKHELPPKINEMITAEKQSDGIIRDALELSKGETDNSDHRVFQKISGPSEKKETRDGKKNIQRKIIKRKTVPGMREKPRKRMSLKDVRDIVSQEEVSIDFEKEKEITERVIPEKVDLTPEERQMAEPVGKFIMNLTKAMLRSGYYDPSHPSSKSAKKGLYDEFIKVAGEFNEIAFACQKTQNTADIFVTGILDQQVNVRNLVGPGVAELFVPRLSEFFDRKQLLSFAIKKAIRVKHFDQFIDIMSDPKVDRDEFAKKGAYLTKALIENDIREISTVFIDDMMELELDLPWRVQMAIHRLAKDLRVMPMFKEISGDAIKTIKLQTVQDIIRPLNHPKYFNDFLVHCYVISKNVSDMKPEEIESIIVEAFPLNLLLPTSQYTFKELDRLQQLKDEQPDNPNINRRFLGIKRIMKMIASRVSAEKPSGTIRFLEQLYRNNILAFKELPVEAQYLVNTRNMADDVSWNFEEYRERLLKIKSPDDAVVYMKCFRRTAPMLIDDGDWEAVLNIANLINESSTIDVISSRLPAESLKISVDDVKKDTNDHASHESLSILDTMLAYVFLDYSDKIISTFDSPDKSRLSLLDEVIDALGALGIDIVSQVLTKSNDKEVRKFCVESLIKKGEATKKWAAGILDQPDLPWYVHRNALMILRNVVEQGEEFECVKKYLNHEKSQIREETINLIVTMRPADAESLIIKAMDDSDVKVRWRATRALADIAPISEGSINEIVNIISQPIPADKNEASEHMKKMMNLISAINGLPDIPNHEKIESNILQAITMMLGHEKGLAKFFKKVIGSEDEIGVLKAAIQLLGRIGGSESEKFLSKLSKSHSQLSESIQKTLEKIRQ